MNDGWSVAHHIAAIISHVFGITVDAAYCAARLYNIIQPNNAITPLEHIHNVINNPTLLSDESITNVVAKQLSMLAIAPQAEFEYPFVCNPNATFTERWEAYINKLEYILQQIKHRVAANYETNLLMPPQHQILELQQECLSLTREYYADGHGNLSSLYLYYIKMCDAAHITRYPYHDIGKFTALDRYVSLLNLNQRSLALEEYDKNIFKAFIKQGGIWAQGRSDIDATSIANIFYYKHAMQLLYLQNIKTIVIELLNISTYGELPAEQREQAWQLIQTHFPADAPSDQENIFYKFANFCNYTPGACFTKLPSELRRNSTPEKIHAAVKLAGLLSGNLVLISRRITEDWTPKRYLVLAWQRQYSLLNLRSAGSIEHLRIWPNEMPYLPYHGLSLCGNGLIEGIEPYGSIAYEWNVPVDEREEIDNSARDIEKMFRELVILSPPLNHKILPGEAYLYLFQNSIAYSSQPTQHLHIGCGNLASYPIFNLPAYFSKYVADLSAIFEMVRVGAKPDSMYIRVFFDDLHNEALLKYLIKLNAALLEHFRSPFPVDSYVKLNVTDDNRYVFILEPHILLIEQADRKFLNPESGSLTIRKPQYLIPAGADVSVFPSNHRLAMLRDGLGFLREFFDATCKRGVEQFFQQYFSRF